MTAPVPFAAPFAGKSNRTLSLLIPLLCALLCLTQARRLNAQVLAPPDPAKLNITGTIPALGELMGDRVVFVFDSEIAMPEAKEGFLGGVLSVPPNAKGELTSASNFITYRFTTPFKDNVFRAVLNPALRSADGKPLNPAHSQLRFASFSFGPGAMWRRSASSDKALLAARFPVDVKLETIEKFISVKDGAGKPIKAAISISKTDRRTCYVDFGLAPTPAYPVSIRFAKGLSDARDEFRMREDRTYTYPLKGSADAFSVRSTRWSTFVGERQVIAFRFNAAIDAEEFARHLTITHETGGKQAPFEITSKGRRSDHLATLRLENLKDVKLRIAIAKELPHHIGRASAKDYSTRLTYQVPALRITRIASMASRQNESNQVSMRLSLNRSIPPEALREHLRFDPPLEAMTIQERSGGRYFYVFGEWASERQYKASITAGVKDAIGIVHDASPAFSFKTKKVPSVLDLSHRKEYYFSRRAQSPLTAKTRNVDKIDMTLYRLFPSNVAVATQIIGNDVYSPSETFRWSEAIATYSQPIDSVPDQLTETRLDLAQLFPADRRGVFFVQARSTGGSVQRTILNTDIGLLAHWRRNELLVYAHDLASLNPLSQTKISVHSTKNQLLAQGNVDDNGFLHLTGLNAALGEPSVIVAEHGDDATFLHLKARTEDKKEFSGASSSYSSGSYDGFAYTDRDLYRPGETIHMRWIVRSNYGDAVSSVPLMLTVTKPDGSVLLTRLSVLSEIGTSGDDIVTQKSHPTGKYSARVTVPGGRGVAVTSFNLEEFVPNRIEASISIDEDYWMAGKDYAFLLDAKHLVGGPAADRRCDASVTIRPGGFGSEQWKGYSFSNDTDFAWKAIPRGEKKTDKNGEATFSFNWKAPVEATMPLTAVVTGHVLELGGRPVTARKEVGLFASDTCLGIDAGADPDSNGLLVRVAAVRPDGAPASLGKVKVSIQRSYYHYYVRRYYHSGLPRWTNSYELIETREVDLSEGRGFATFTIDNPGYYRVRVHSDETPQFSTKSIYKGYHGQPLRVVSSVDPSLIKVALDKTSYQAGEEAEIRIESSLDGKAVVVIQGEEIQEASTVDIKNGVGVARFRIEDEHAPNVWAEVTVIHGQSDGDAQSHPFSSFAAANIVVCNPRRAIEVAFPSLPKEIRPAREVRFEVVTEDSDGKPIASEITLAAVDEGVHQILGYRNPDPLSWFSRSRRPDVRRAHYYDKVAFDDTKPEPGGGRRTALAEMAKRLAMEDETWIKPVALWSGAVKTGADGRAFVTMRVPEFSGQLRLVAVACTDKAVGARDAKLFVRRPYSLRTSMPRFLLPEDTFRPRATLFNHTETTCSARVSWASRGAIAATSGSATAVIGPNREWTASVPFVADRMIGQGHLEWEVVVSNPSGGEIERLKQSAPLPVRASAAYQSEHDLIILPPGTRRVLRNTTFIEDERAAIEVSIGADPNLRLEESLKYVVGYPYGCIEQTSSRLMPLYLLRSSRSMASAAMEPGASLDDFIRVGIDRLFSMQTASGGLGYWPGSTTPYPYGSIYALHFLTLVENDREFYLPEDNMRRLREYAAKLVGDLNDGSTANQDPAVLYRRAYATYVLSLGGDLKAIEQIRRFDNIDIPRASRLLLAAALAQHTGDHDLVSLYLTKTPSTPYTVRTRDETLNSDIRNTAIEVIALRAIGGRDKEIFEKAKSLIDFLQRGQYGSSQERAFIVTALSGFFRDLAKNIDEAGATITAGKKGKTRIAGRETFRKRLEGGGNRFVINNTGKSELIVNVTTSGIPSVARNEAVSEGVSIARSISHSTGAAHTNKPFRQGDSYVVSLRITCNDSAKNMVIADLLPAGFEIENPRLDPNAPAARRAASNVKPSYIDIRDDRLILAFNSLSKGSRTFSYVVRAVTPGEYQYPPVTIECMYDASIRGASEASSIVVEEY